MGDTKFLRVQVGALLLDCLEIEAQLAECLLGDHRGQESVERLLGAAVGIVDEVGEGVDHRAGQ